MYKYRKIIRSLLSLIGLSMFCSARADTEWTSGSILWAAGINWNQATSGAVTAEGDTVVMAPYVVKADPNAGFDWDAYFQWTMQMGYDPVGEFTFKGLFNSNPTPLINQNNVNAALAYLKKTLPAFFQKMLQNADIRMIPGLKVNGKDAAGNSKWAGNHVIIEINTYNTPGYDQFKQKGGTDDQWAAVVILHEGMHGYYHMIGRDQWSDASSAMQEASVRYWVETWAIKNGLPETSPNARVNGQANWSSILQEVIDTGYSTKTNAQVTNPGAPLIIDNPYATESYVTATCSVATDAATYPSSGWWVGVIVNANDNGGISELGAELSNGQNIGSTQMGGATTASNVYFWYYVTGVGNYTVQSYYWNANHTQKIISATTSFYVYGNPWD